MKNKTLTGIIIIFILSLLISCQKKERVIVPMETPEIEQIEAEIQAMETAFAEAYNNGTANGEGYYAPDAASYSQNKPPLLGADVIAHHIKKEMKEMPKGAKISFTLTEIFPSNDAEQVVELGRYNVADSLGLSIARGNYMALFVKKDGKYLCVRDMGASEKPLDEK